MTVESGPRAFASDPTIPPLLAALLERLAQELDARASVWAMSSPREDESGHLVEPDLISVVGNAEHSLRIAREIRSLLTAYAHRFATPRPSIAALAAAQSADVTAMRARYNASHVDAIEQLLTNEPDLEVIATAVPSLSRDQIADALGMTGSAKVDFVYPERPIFIRSQAPERTTEPIDEPELTADEMARLRLVSSHAPGYTLLGVVVEQLRTRLSFYARWVDAWLSGPSDVRLEWNNGPTVATVVSDLLPSPTDLEVGVPGLRVLDQDLNSAALEWLHPDGKVDLRLTRSSNPTTRTSA